MDRLAAYTLREILLASTEKFGRKPALALLGGRSWTYREVERKALSAALTLAGMGFKRGDRIGLLAESCPEWGVAYFAITSAGFVVVPILPDCIASQVENIVRHSDCAAVVVSRKQEPKLAGLASEPREVLDLATLAAGPEEKPEEDDYTADPVEAAWDVFPPPEEDDLAAILYTSGTTGRPKGVMLSHGAIAHNVEAIPSVTAIKASDRFLSILPMAHAYECTVGFLGPFRAGASISYLPKPPSASVLLPALKSVRPTMMLSVPLIIEKVVRDSVFPVLNKMKLPRNERLKGLFKSIMASVAGRKLKETFGGKLRFFGIGGAPLAPDVEDFLRAARFPYAIGYGMTEAAPLIAGAPPERTKARSCGYPLQGVKVRIAEPDAAGNGEIQVLGPNLMRGYYREPELTAGAFTPDGWLRTGDLGSMDQKGFITIHGRSKTMILGPSGENIYPEEIEALINAQDIVEDSLVYGDSTHGITALIQLKPEVVERLLEGAAAKADALGSRVKELEKGAGSLLEAVKKAVNERLALFARVKRVVIQHEPFERTPTRKIKRDKYPPKGAPSPEPPPQAKG